MEDHLKCPKCSNDVPSIDYHKKSDGSFNCTVIEKKVIKTVTKVSKAECPNCGKPVSDEDEHYHEGYCDMGGFYTCNHY